MPLKAHLFIGCRALRRAGARSRDTAAAGWDWIERSRLRASIAGPLFAAAILALLSAAVLFVDRAFEGDRSVVDEIRSSEIWVAEPTVYAGAERILENGAGSTRRTDALEVRTAQELANGAPALVDRPVIVVGRIAAIERRDAAHPDLGQTEVALLGDDRRSRVVLVGGVSIGRTPPPLVPRTHSELVPAPGSLQRFEPDYRFGMFVGMVAAIGTTTSPDGGPARTIYFLASRASLGTSRKPTPRLGPAVRQALGDL